ncbi:MAG: ThiF family adenylyltransferase [Planctomycetota bacterium]
MLDDTQRRLHARQIRLAEMGEEGQARLLASTAAVVGMGALGCASSLLLLRSGVRHLRLVDRDFVEEGNVARQILYTPGDAREPTPKVVAARRELLRVDPDAPIEAHIADVNSATIESLLSGADVILDGLDNFETRYLLNDFAVARGIPWIYAGVVATSALAFPIVPRRTACLRCLFPDSPEPGALETCESAGVLTALPALVAAVQVAEAVKLLAGGPEKVSSRVLAIDAWEGTYRQGPRSERRADCPCCGRAEYPYLSGGATGQATSLCGRDAVQIQPGPTAIRLDLPALSRRLPPEARARLSEWLLRFEADGLTFHLFPDGRAIVKGTDDPVRARALYAKFVGC